MSEIQLALYPNSPTTLVPFNRRTEIAKVVLYQPRCDGEQVEIPTAEIYVADGQVTGAFFSLHTCFVAFPLKHWREGWKVAVEEPGVDWFVHDVPWVVGDFVALSATPTKAHDGRWL